MTNFEKFTASPAVLGAFLASLHVMTGPWDDAFHRAYCDACTAEDCDGPGGCPHQEIRGRVISWWMDREAAGRE